MPGVVSGTRSIRSWGAARPAVPYTDHVTSAMIPVAATASQNAATAQDAATSTQQLTLGIAQIDTTARALRDQARQLEGLVSAFILDESGPAAVAAPVRFEPNRLVARTVSCR